MPEAKPLRSVEDLLVDAQRLCQTQMEYLAKERAGGGLAAVLTMEEMNLLGMLVRTLKTIGDKTGGAGTGGEDLAGLSDDEIQRRIRAK